MNDCPFHLFIHLSIQIFTECFYARHFSVLGTERQRCMPFWMLDFNAAFQKIVLKRKIANMMDGAKYYGERWEENRQECSRRRQSHQGSQRGPHGGGDLWKKLWRSWAQAMPSPGDEQTERVTRAGPWGRGVQGREQWELGWGVEGGGWGRANGGGPARVAVWCRHDGFSSECKGGHLTEMWTASFWLLRGEWSKQREGEQKREGIHCYHPNKKVMGA